MTDEHDAERPEDSGQRPHDRDSGPTEYEVGYRKPPKSGQFKPGRSGNPRGRKKRHPTFAERLNKELARKVIITEHGKKRSVPKLDLILMTMTNQAAKGDSKALSMIINLLNTQAADPSPDLNTEAMTAEDLAILEGYLSGVEMGEPYVGPTTIADADNDDDAGKAK